MIRLEDAVVVMALVICIMVRTGIISGPSTDIASSTNCDDREYCFFPTPSLIWLKTL